MSEWTEFHLLILLLSDFFKGDTSTNSEKVYCKIIYLVFVIENDDILSN